jgi:hypothetical protein
LIKDKKPVIAKILIGIQFVIKSLSFEQDEILKSIIDLYCSDGFDADITYGNGVFYKNIPQPKYKLDADPQTFETQHGFSDDLPFDNETLNSIVFDPPFLTYIKAGRDTNMIMGKRFSGYWRYDELQEHYTNTFKDVARVLKKNGYLILKCQDIIHNHKLHPTHIYATQWAGEHGLKLKDLFILGAKHRLPNPNKNGKQKHARVYHSYFMVFQK